MNIANVYTYSCTYTIVCDDNIARYFECYIINNITVSLHMISSYNMCIWLRIYSTMAFGYYSYHAAAAVLMKLTCYAHSMFMHISKACTSFIKNN